MADDALQRKKDERMVQALIDAGHKALAEDVGRLLYVSDGNSMASQFNRAAGAGAYDAQRTRLAKETLDGVRVQVEVILGEDWDKDGNDGQGGMSGMGGMSAAIDDGPKDAFKQTAGNDKEAEKTDPDPKIAGRSGLDDLPPLPNIGGKNPVTGIPHVGRKR